MKIALLSYSTKPRGGVVHTLALAEALTAQGQDVTVWTLGRDGDTGFFRPVDPGVQQRVVPFPPDPTEAVGPRILRSIQTLGKAFEPERYDVVHAQDCISANAVERCVRTVHHLDHFTTPELAACHEKAIVRPFAHVCVSPAVAEEVEAGWGIRPVVIPNGVAADRFEAAEGSVSAASWRRQLGRYVLAVGGIEPRKGSLDLLESFALLREPDLRLVIAGGETLFDYRDYRHQWEQRAYELGIQPIVLGPVAHNDLPGLVAGAAAFAMPSTKEGFGLAGMEALAAGVPVVARDLPVLRDLFGGVAWLAHEPTGLAHGLRELLDNTDVQRKQAGRERARSYTWHAAAHAHLHLYESLQVSGRGLHRMTASNSKLPEPFNTCTA